MKFICTYSASSKGLNTSNYLTVTNDVVKDMETYCKNRFNKPCYIKNNTFIDYKTLRKLRELIKITSQSIVTECIETQERDGATPSYTFIVEDACNTCGTLSQVEVGKSGLLDIIAQRTVLECDCCESKRKAAEREYQKNADIIRAQRTQKETTFFIENYCNPNKVWNDTVSPNSYYPELQKAFNYYVSDEAVKKYLAEELSYSDFLKTPYWKAVAQKKRCKAKFKCELCGCNGQLNVHHKSYKNHGNEINHLDDLIVLCSHCHAKFHDKLEAENE